nr:hypothetical protein [Tanacetum cinerariifolium]
MKCLGIAKLEVVGGGIRSQIGQVGGAGGGAEVLGSSSRFWRVFQGTGMYSTSFQI